MKRVIAAAVMMLAVSATAAFAEEGRAYAGMSVGMFIPHDGRLTSNTTGASGDMSYDVGFTINGVGGYELGNGLRFEGEIVYKASGTDKLTGNNVGVKVNSDVWSIGGMANAYYDFRTGTVVTPYIGVGIGFANVNVGTGNVNGFTVYTSSDDTVFAYQAAVGLGFQLNRNLTLDVGYRYYATTDVKYQLATAEFGSSNVTAGLRYRF